MFIKILAVQLFDSEIEAVVVAFILIGSGRAGLIDDVELGIVCVACLYSAELGRV